MMEAFYIILTLIGMGILLAKLANVMKFSTFYDMEWGIVGFVAFIFCYLYILLMTLFAATEDALSELTVYMWVWTAMLAVTVILTFIEILLFFTHVIKKKKGSEEYGERGRFETS